MCPNDYRKKSDSISCKLCSISKLCDLVPKLQNEQIPLRNDDIVTKKKKYAKNEIIFSANEELQQYVIIHSGATKNFIMINGKEQIVDFSFPGDIIGLEAINDRVAKNSVVALSDVEVCLIDFTDLNTLITSNLSVNELVRKLMCDKINEQQNMLIAYAQKKAEAKIATFIYMIYQKFLNNMQVFSSIKLFMSRAEIANYLNLTIETVSRVMTKLVEQEIIAVKGRYITILNLNALKNYA